MSRRKRHRSRARHRFRPTQPGALRARHPDRRERMCAVHRERRSRSGRPPAWVRSNRESRAVPRHPRRASTRFRWPEWRPTGGHGPRDERTRPLRRCRRAPRSAGFRPGSGRPLPVHSRRDEICGGPFPRDEETAPVRRRHRATRYLPASRPYRHRRGRTPL